MPRTTRRGAFKKHKGGMNPNAQMQYASLQNASMHDASLQNASMHDAQVQDPQVQDPQVQDPYSSKLYVSQDQFTPETIESIFCNGRTLDQLTQNQEKPIYILKWGPPGSGKSSEKITEIINSKIPNNDYVDYSTDKLIENYIPYRAKTLIAKLEYERAKGYYITKQWAAIRVFLTKIKDNSEFASIRGQLEKIINRGTLPDNEEMYTVFKTILYKSLSSAYMTTRNSEKNTAGNNLYSKMVAFTQKCFEKKVNIVYETLGGGYDMSSDMIRVENQFSSGVTSRLATKSTVANEEFVFKNHWEKYLGKIKFTSDGIPTLDRSSFTKETIPIEYRIFVIYPLLDKNEIIRRSYTRALSNLLDAKRQTINITKEYRYILDDYIENVLAVFAMDGVESARVKEGIENLIDTSIHDEKELYIGKTDTASITKSIKDAFEQLKTSDASTVQFPFFRAISPAYIYDIIKQSFNYSIDYFLKQYILVGRIQEVVYINNKDAFPSKLFLDMDGVFADFESRFQEVLRKKRISKNAEPRMTQYERWSLLMKKDRTGGFEEDNNAHFFDNLNKMQDADKLWESVNDFIVRSGQKVPIFLTGCPVTPFRKWAEEGKEAWVQKELLAIPVKQTKTMTRSRSGGLDTEKRTIYTYSVPEYLNEEDKQLRQELRTVSQALEGSVVSTNESLRIESIKIKIHQNEERVKMDVLYPALQELEATVKSGDVIMIFCRPEQKQLYSAYGTNPILIDDRTNAGPQWIAENVKHPIFIHHRFLPVSDKKYNKSYRNALSRSAVNFTRKTLARLRGGKGRKTRRT